MTTPFPKEDCFAMSPELGKVSVFNVEGTWFYVTVDERHVPTAAAQRLSMSFWKGLQEE